MQQLLLYLRTDGAALEALLFNILVELPHSLFSQPN